MLKAKHVMKKDVTVRKDTPVYQSLYLMVKHRITGIPVVQDDMNLVGLISEKDVLHLFYEQQNLGKKQLMTL